MTQIQYKIEKKLGAPNVFVFQVELDADALERLAIQMGWLNPDFLKAIDQAEDDFQKGAYKSVSSSSCSDERLLARVGVPRVCDLAMGQITKES